MSNSTTASQPAAYEWFDQSGGHHLTMAEPPDYELALKVTPLFPDPMGQQLRQELLETLDILVANLENELECEGHNPADDARIKLARSVIAKATAA